MSPEGKDNQQEAKKALEAGRDLRNHDPKSGLMAVIESALHLAQDNDLTVKGTAKIIELQAKNNRALSKDDRRILRTTAKGLKNKKQD